MRTRINPAVFGSGRNALLDPLASVLKDARHTYILRSGALADLMQLTPSSWRGLGDTGVEMKPGAEEILVLVSEHQGPTMTSNEWQHWVIEQWRLEFSRNEAHRINDRYATCPHPTSIQKAVSEASDYDLTRDAGYESAMTKLSKVWNLIIQVAYRNRTSNYDVVGRVFDPFTLQKRIKIAWPYASVLCHLLGVQPSSLHIARHGLSEWPSRGEYVFYASGVSDAVEKSIIQQYELESRTVRLLDLPPSEFREIIRSCIFSFFDVHGEWIPPSTRSLAEMIELFTCVYRQSLPDITRMLNNYVENMTAGDLNENRWIHYGKLTTYDDDDDDDDDDD